jgi:type IV pilus assembly protein PilA
MRVLKLQRKSVSAQGFSLVELLVVISVIAIIASVALPNLFNITRAAEDVSARRSAQHISSVYNSAVAAGAFTPGDFPVSLEELIAILRVGVNGGTRFPNLFFSLDGMDAVDLDRIDDFLEYDPESGILSLLASASAAADDEEN